MVCDGVSVAHSFRGGFRDVSRNPQNRLHRRARGLRGGAGVGSGQAAVQPAASPASDKPAAPAEGKAIDLVICLDVSGSMDGLIDSAKIRLWDIVNELARIKPTPEPPRRALQLRRNRATPPTRAG